MFFCFMRVVWSAVFNMGGNVLLCARPQRGPGLLELIYVAVVTEVPFEGPGLAGNG